jgi:hypothetical protein
MKAARPANRKVTAENLAGLGAERLAEILAGVAETRPDLKRRLRMELAAEQGVAPLSAEIDRRLASFETSRGQVGWRQWPAFLRDLEALRELIALRLAPLDRPGAIERLWRYLEAGRQVASRLRERERLDPIFAKAAGALGHLTVGAEAQPLASKLVAALSANPGGWSRWLPDLLEGADRALAALALALARERPVAAPGWIALVRQLADAAGDPDAYRETYGDKALATPAVAAELGRRYLAAGRIEAAGAILSGAAPRPRRWSAAVSDPDFDWESVWIDYLEISGDQAGAQAARWSSFERTLSVERARAFIRRLADFDDVEAEERAFAIAGADADFERGLSFLMQWPSLGQAARMIEARKDEAVVDPEAAELWGGKLRSRWPRAAEALLRQTAAAAFRRREYKTSERLVQEADSIGSG